MVPPQTLCLTVRPCVWVHVMTSWIFCQLDIYELLSSIIQFFKIIWTLSSLLLPREFLGPTDDFIAHVVTLSFVRRLVSESAGRNALASSRPRAPGTSGSGTQATVTSHMRVQVSYSSWKHTRFSATATASLTHGTPFDTAAPASGYTASHLPDSGFCSLYVSHWGLFLARPLACRSHATLAMRFPLKPGSRHSETSSSSERAL